MEDYVKDCLTLPRRKPTEYITGGDGFIGSALRRRLPHLTQIPYKQIPKFILQPFKRLFFLSAYGNMYGQNDLDRMIHANVLDPSHLLNEAAIRTDFKSFIYMSSSSCGLKVRSDYACSKLAAEQYLLGRDLPVCVVRPYSVTGVGEQRQHLIPALIRSCMEGEPITITPKPTHDYVDVDDICAGLDLLSSEDARGIFELGSGIKTSNEEVLALVEQVTGRNANARIVNTTLREYDSEDWVCRDSSAQQYGWTPTKALKQSIEEMVAAYCEAKK